MPRRPSGGRGVGSVGSPTRPPPSPKLGVTSPKRAQEHDGPFPRLYEPPPKFTSGSSSTALLPPPVANEAIKANGARHPAANGANGAIGGRSGRLRKPPNFGSGDQAAAHEEDAADGTGPNDERDALTQRLDEQYAQLMQFQQMAMAADRRADAALRMNRYLIVGLATAALVAILSRSR